MIVKEIFFETVLTHVNPGISDERIDEVSKIIGKRACDAIEKEMVDFLLKPAPKNFVYRFYDYLKDIMNSFIWQIKIKILSKGYKDTEQNVDFSSYYLKEME